MSGTSAQPHGKQASMPVEDLNRTVGAAEFKARCLQIMNRVSQTGAEVTITKHGRPIAKLVPVPAGAGRRPVIGACKGSLVIADDNDLVPSTADEWAEWVGADP